MSTKKKLAKGAAVVSSATLVSRILGYIRDMVIARYFGAGLSADAFFVAFRIPNTLRELVGEGALSASLVPVFTEQISQNKKKEAWEMVASLLNLMIILLIVVTILGVLLSPYIVKILAPGFSQIPSKFELTVFLNRLMFPYILLMGLAALMMGVLNSLGHFSTPALSPTLLNISIIIFTLLLSTKLSEPTLALAIGVLVGGVGQLLLQMAAAVKKGLRFMGCLNLRDPALQKILVLMLPACGGLAVAQLSHFISTFLASFLEQGSVSYLYYSMRMVHLPIALIGVALGTAILPSFSEAAARKDINELRDTLSFALRLSFFMTLPVMVFYVFFRIPIIQVLFERGVFDRHATNETAQALLFYSLGLIFFVSNRIVVPAFYSLQDTKTPVKISMVAIAGNILLSLLLVLPMGFGGLALANSLASALNFGLLFWYLQKRLGYFEGKKILDSWARTAAASVVMGLVAFLYVYLLDHYFVPIINHSRLLERAFWLALGFIFSGGTFIGFAYLFRSGEFLALIKLVREKAGRVTPAFFPGEDEP